MISVLEEDIREVVDWLDFPASMTRITPAWLPMEEKQAEINRIRETYSHFPEEVAHTKRLEHTVLADGPLRPVFIALGDPELFVIEGKHRMVAFHNAGMRHIPVAFVDCASDPLPNLGAYLASISWPASN